MLKILVLLMITDKIKNILEKYRKFWIFNKFIRIFDVYLLCFVYSTKLYLSINTIVLKLFFSYESGKYWGGGALTLQSEASKILGGTAPSQALHEPPMIRLNVSYIIYKH